jgi:hypothetical protein
MAKVIYTGAEDSGKSYQLALRAGKLVERNAKWLRITGRPRPIASNLEFQPWFEEMAMDLGVPIIYWKDLEQLPHMGGCDLIMDEMGTYFDSRTFKDLPLDVRLWVAQASKLGTDIYGSAQDFAQVDVSFRRLVKGPTNGLFMITKMLGSDRPHPTKPPVSKIWGVCMMRELDAMKLNQDSSQFASVGLPHFFVLRKEICNIFDTTKRIAKSAPVPYKHIERYCTDPNCDFKKNKIVDGRHVLVSHA